ncbi:solute carrier family 35 member E3-like [Galendromus occidentalis]|uniref:Solute carrier family 35 member E3-like n=1 Tax=Galendromus occidentalis TaxID=34638 RepID=A0AAJ7L6Z5_9ACAR|nr:solute carrier family 35 member E3-like [Galendromus occidentalis]
MKRGILDSPLATGPKANFARIGLLMNFVLSVSSMVILKFIFYNFEFPALTTTLVHFSTSTCLMIATRLTQSIPWVSLRWGPVCKLGVGFSLLVTFTNLSLYHNSLISFVMLKTTTLIWIPAMHRLFSNFIFSWSTLLALCPVISGILLHFCFEQDMNSLGILYGILGAMVTSAYQLYLSEKQKEMQVDSLQLLLYEAPIGVLLLIPISWYFDRSEIYAESPAFTWHLPLLLLVSGACTSIVPFTEQWTIGHTSTAEYNVVSQMKFAVTLFIGYNTFNSLSYRPIQIMGHMMTLSGIVVYTHLKVS